MLSVFRVKGSSMLPLLAGGDFVIASRRYRRLAPGDLVVASHCAYGCIVKRVSQVSSQGWVKLRGENSSSVSSLDMGWLEPGDIVAKVLLRISSPVQSRS